MRLPRMCSAFAGSGKDDYSEEGAWLAEPHPAPGLEGDFAENRVLQGMELFATPSSHAPEDVAVDAEGLIYVGVAEGQVLRYAADGSSPEVFADTGGRPIGLDFDNNGNLIVADPVKGLLSIDPNGAIQVLCTEAGYHPLRLTDDVDVDSQNVAWFSDASYKWNYHQWMSDVLESAPNGRLLKYDIRTGECSVVLDDLFWLVLFAPRNETLDSAGPKPWLRKLLYRLPAALKPKPRRHPVVLGLDASGKIVHNLQDADGIDFSMSTSAEQVGDWLYVGSIGEAKWGRIRISSLP